jgi:ribA/ribD-fused uncharacterized protein
MEDVITTIANNLGKEIDTKIINEMRGTNPEFFKNKNGMRVTDKYVLFWGGVFSNFYPCNFETDDGVWSSSEQYFMFLKAKFFEDDETAEKIKLAETPKEAKKLGRQVKNFDEKKWEDHRRTAMFMALENKFLQNKELKDELLSEEYKDKSFVEASPVDNIWGIGLHYDDPLADDEKNWKGLNLLGKTLDHVRIHIKMEPIG